MLKQANVATCVQEMVEKTKQKKWPLSKINNFNGKMNLDNEKISLHLHKPALNKQSIGRRGMVCGALLVCRVKSSPNKRCHWSRMSTVQPANRAANKGHYSSRGSIVLLTKLVIARSRMSSATGASSSSASLRTLEFCFFFKWIINQWKDVTDEI